MILQRKETACSINFGASILPLLISRKDEELLAIADELRLSKQTIPESPECGKPVHCSARYWRKVRRYYMDFTLRKVICKRKWTVP